MFFILSKAFWALAQPLTFISILICGGWLLRARKCGQRVLTVGVVSLLIFGFLPVGHNLLVFEEHHFPPLETLPEKIDGIIVLGGPIDFKKSFYWGQGQLNEHAPRITEMIALMHYYPKAKIVFSGGNGSLTLSSSSESIELQKLLKHMNIDMSRIIFEGKSRNTYENMVLSKELAKPKEGETWLLVTSAYHMRRSAAIFNSNGWEIIPYPAGYLSNGQYLFYPTFYLVENMYKLQVAVREIIGIMAYQLSGKIK